MANGKDVRTLDPNQLGSVGGGAVTLGVYRPGFQYKKESLRFFRECVGEDVYARAMSSEAGRAHHYSVVRAFLNQTDWEKFCWIEQYGTLDGFPGTV